MTKDMQYSTILKSMRLTAILSISIVLILSQSITIFVPDYATGQKIYQYSDFYSSSGYSSDFNLGLNGYYQIPDYPTIPFNQYPSIPENALKGSEIPKNLIIGPNCQQSCPPIIGTNKDDIIYATAVADSLVYGLKGDDAILSGTGNPQTYGGEGDDVLFGGSGNSQIFGGKGDDVIKGGFGNNLLLGGKGNDQIYAGPGHDLLIGGKGANFFDCGTSGNAIILDFNPSKGDIKAGNCKFVVSVNFDHDETFDDYDGSNDNNDKKNDNDDNNDKKNDNDDNNDKKND